MKTANFYENIPAAAKEEVIEILASSPSVRIERITSLGQTSPENFWYDQEENEFVILLQGNAELEFEEGKKATLKPGDYINIPAGAKHRVSSTDKKNNTLWLAVFY